MTYTMRPIQCSLRIDDVTVTSDQDLRSQVSYRCIHIKYIYHVAKFECSRFSSLANTGGGGGLKGPPVLQGTKEPEWNRVSRLSEPKRYST